MATRDILRDFVPAMVAVSDAVCDRWIAYAAARLSSTEWGTLFEQGVCYLAGHMYLRSVATAAGGGGAGTVTSESAGGMSRSYGGVTVSQWDADLGTTAPGLAFLQLRREAIMVPTMLQPPTTYEV